MSKNLLMRLLSRGPAEVSRFSISDYLRALTNQRYGLIPTYAPAVTYARGQPSERVENSFTGYVYGAYKQNPVVFAVMAKRASIFSEARFLWRHLDDGRPGDLFNNDDLDVLRRPWPNGTTGELLTRMIQDVDLSGNFYAVNEGDRLRRLRPDWVQIVLSGDPRLEADIDVMGYTYSPGGPDNPSLETYLPGDICHWSPQPDPDALYRGMSWLTPIVREIQGDLAAIDHKLAFFANGATLGPIVRAPEAMSIDKFREFVEAAEAAHVGVNNAYKTMYIGGGADVTLSAATMQQMDFETLQGHAETRICVAAQVPAVIVGVSEGLKGSSLNSGNYQSAKRAFVDSTLRTLWRSACASLQTIMKVPADAELWFDESDIAFLREDQKDAAAIQQTQMATIVSGIQGGFEPDSMVAIINPAWKALKHTGLTSVQLLPPGSPGEPPNPDAPPPSDGPTGGGGGANGDTAGAVGEQARAITALATALGIERGHPHPGQHYKHGWIPIAPAAELLSQADIDRDYGETLDHVGFMPDGRVVAHAGDNVTVQFHSGIGDQSHVWPAPDTRTAARWGQHITDALRPDAEPSVEDGLYVGRDARGEVQVRWVGEATHAIDPADYEGPDLTPAEAKDMGQALRDMSYIAEDYAAHEHDAADELPDEPDTPGLPDEPDHMRSRYTYGGKFLERGHPHPGQQYKHGWVPIAPGAIVRKTVKLGGTEIGVSVHPDRSRTLDFPGGQSVRLERHELAGHHKYRNSLRSLAYDAVDQQPGEGAALSRITDTPGGGARKELLLGVKKVAEAPDEHPTEPGEETWDLTPVSLHLPPNDDPSYDELLASPAVATMRQRDLVTLAEMDIPASRVDVGGGNTVDVFRDGGKFTIRPAGSEGTTLDTRGVRALYGAINDLLNSDGRELRPDAEIARQTVATKAGDFVVSVTGEGHRLQVAGPGGLSLDLDQDHVYPFLGALGDLTDSASASRALVDAFDLIAGGWVIERGGHDVSGELRNPKGTVGGGRFRSLTARIADALTEWKAGTGPDDPLAGFTQPQLRTAATQLGLNPPKGMKLVPLKELILGHAHDTFREALVEKQKRRGSAKFSIREGGKRAPDLVSGIAADMGLDLGDYRTTTPDVQMIHAARGFVADSSSPGDAAHEMRKFILSRDGEVFLRHNTPSADVEAQRQKWMDLAQRIEHAPSLSAPAGLSGGHKIDVAVYTDQATGTKAALREVTPGNRPGRTITSQPNLAGLEQWAHDNGHVDVAQWAAGERARLEAKNAPRTHQTDTGGRITEAEAWARMHGDKPMPKTTAAKAAQTAPAPPPPPMEAVTPKEPATPRTAYDILLGTGPGSIAHKQTRVILEQMEAHGWRLDGAHPAGGQTSWVAPDGRRLTLLHGESGTPTFLSGQNMGARKVSFKQALAIAVTPTPPEGPGFTRPNVYTATDRLGLPRVDHYSSAGGPVHSALAKAQSDLQGGIPANEVARRLRETAQHQRDLAPDAINARADVLDRYADDLVQQDTELKAHNLEVERLKNAPLDIRPSTRGAPSPAPAPSPTPAPAPAEIRTPQQILHDLESEMTKADALPTYTEQYARRLMTKLDRGEITPAEAIDALNGMPAGSQFRPMADRAIAALRSLDSSPAHQQRTALRREFAPQLDALDPAAPSASTMRDYMARWESGQYAKGYMAGIMGDLANNEKADPAVRALAGELSAAFKRTDLPENLTDRIGAPKAPTPRTPTVQAPGGLKPLPVGFSGTNRTDIELALETKTPAELRALGDSVNIYISPKLRARQAIATYLGRTIAEADRRNGGRTGRAVFAKVREADAARSTATRYRGGPQRYTHGWHLIAGGLANLSDDALLDHFHNLSQADVPDEAALHEIDAELARREAVPFVDSPESRRVDELLGKGYGYLDAYAEVHGLDVTKLERQQRMARVDQERMPGETRAKTIRRMHAEHVALAALQAEDDTNGNLLNQLGRAKGIDPATLWSGQAARARKYASDELKEWWSLHGGRMTAAQWAEQFTGGTAATAAARQAGNGRDYGV